MILPMPPLPKISTIGKYDEQTICVRGLLKRLENGENGSHDLGPGVIEHRELSVFETSLAKEILHLRGVIQALKAERKAWGVE